jgi:hypothetical protein
MTRAKLRGGCVNAWYEKTLLGLGGRTGPHQQKTENCGDIEEMLITVPKLGEGIIIVPRYP